MKVFDASAALAMVFAEPGADQAERLSEGGDAVISSVNHAEVVARLVDRGMTGAEVDAVCEGLPLQVLPFTEAQALAELGGDGGRLPGSASSGSSGPRPRSS